MKEIYKVAFSELDEIFKLLPDSILNKIPTKFKEIVKNEKAKDYKPNIEEPIEECELKEETIIILALIYRDFLCTEEEKKLLHQRDYEKLKEAEDEIRKKYNPDDIFKNKNRIVEKPIQTTEETRMIVVQEEKWYKKIFNLIKGLFSKTK